MGGTSYYYVNRALNHVRLTMSETIKKTTMSLLCFILKLVLLKWADPLSHYRLSKAAVVAPRRSPKQPRDANRVLVWTQGKVELLCGRTSARNSILILQDRCRVRRSLQRQRPNNGLNCIRQPAGPKIAAKKKKKKVRQVVRQLPAFHVLHFKHLLPDAGAVKLAMRSSCEPAAFHSLSGIF